MGNVETVARRHALVKPRLVWPAACRCMTCCHHSSQQARQSPKCPARPVGVIGTVWPGPAPLGASPAWRPRVPPRSHAGWCTARRRGSFSAGGSRPTCITDRLPPAAAAPRPGVELKLERSACCGILKGCKQMAGGCCHLSVGCELLPSLLYRGRCRRRGGCGCWHRAGQLLDVLLEVEQGRRGGTGAGSDSASCA